MQEDYKSAGYGWNPDLGPHSCGYLGPAILAELARRPTRTVLDLGCGNGALLNVMSTAGYTVAGTERDESGAAIARRSNPGASIYRLDLADNYAAIQRDSPEGFDAIVSTEVVEHPYPPRMLPAFARPLLSRAISSTEASRLILTTPYHGWAKNVAIAVLGQWDKHHDPLWDYGHIKFFSRHSLTRLLEREGFTSIRFKGVGRVPYLWKSMMVTTVASAMGDSQ